MSEFTRPVEKLSQSAREYLDLQVDDLKLRTAKGLSISLNHLLSMILVLFCASVVLLALAFGCILLLGQLIGSYALGAFIVAALFAVLTLVLFRVRDKLFLNGFVKMFIGLFFDEEEVEDE
ncbi:MAG: hypothetical protein J6S66_05050 [Bacteroidales bacterium]|nr:hypothetical protein [Bacteroidales bacterium]